MEREGFLSDHPGTSVDPVTPDTLNPLLRESVIREVSCA